MKGQFFIISTVIMISSLILITQYLYDYGKVDLADTREMQELKYIEDIQDTLRSTVLLSCKGGTQENLDANLEFTEQFLKSKFLERGMVLDITSQATCTPISGKFNFTIKTNEYEIENSFLV